MRRLPVLVLVLSGFLSQALYSADQRHLTVVDYFLLLPADTFEGTPSEWLKFIKQPAGGGVIDTANGYLNCTGDGAQPPFQVALFRFSDGRPLLAVCTGELEGENSLFLVFYELGRDSQMRVASRKIFPIQDGGALREIYGSGGIFRATNTISSPDSSVSLRGRFGNAL